MSLNDVQQRKAAADAKRASLKAELDVLAEKTNPTEGDVQRGERLLRGYENASAECDRLENELKVEMLRAARAGELTVETTHDDKPRYRGTAATSRRDRIWQVEDVRSESPAGWKARANDALEATRDEIGDKAAEMYGRGADREFEVGFATVALSNPDYQSAFLKWVKNPERGAWTMDDAERRAVETVEGMRSALSTNTGTGGWLIPQAISPTTVLTGDGIASPIHEWANNEVTAQSPFRQPTTPGATAEWKSEGVAASDGAPAFSKVDIALYTTSIYAAASYEVLQDTDLARRLPFLFAEEQREHEAAAFVVGSGSGSPYGAVSEAAATTASRVSPTTAGTFTSASVNDVYKVWDALEPRARASSRTAVIANNAVLTLVRKMGSTLGNSYTVDLTGRLESLFGKPIAEASSMDSSMTTGSDILLMGDWSRYTIVRHVLGSQLHYIPSVFDGDYSRPTAQAGFHLVSRVGGSTTDINAFRVLTL